VPTAGYITLLNLPIGGLGPGTRVLVNGAAGGVGAIAVQLAKAHGAEVTGVDHTRKLDLVRSLGADHVLDYTRQDFTEGGQRYDLLFDVPGNHSLAACRRALAPDGSYVLIGHDNFGKVGRAWLGSLPRFARLGLQSLVVRQLRRADSARPTKTEAMAALRTYLEAGQLTPIIDRAYPLAEAGAALRHLADGDAVGRVVVTA
jgi:NADPH:quinone reductase-like Zn-dependent oxidoreductase